MNPKTMTAQSRAVRDEVRRIREAWPEAQVRWTLDELAATLIVCEPESTYIVSVEPDRDGVRVRSLWVSHRRPIGESYIPEWTDGWVD